MSLKISSAIASYGFVRVGGGYEKEARLGGKTSHLAFETVSCRPGFQEQECRSSGLIDRLICYVD